MIGASSSAEVAGVGAERAGDVASPVALSMAAISVVPGEKNEDVSKAGLEARMARGAGNGGAK